MTHAAVDLVPRAENLADRVRPELLAVLDDDGRLAAVSATAYTHANGFDRFLLVDGDPSGARVRLHVWWPDINRVAEHLHNHAWDFSSVVLAGRLRFETADWDDEGKQHWHYCSHPPVPVVGGYRYPFSEHGRRGVRTATSAAMSPGSAYSLDHRVLHRVETNPLEPVVTLMVHSPLRRQTSDVLAPHPIRPSTAQVTSFTIDETRQKLLALLDILR